MFKENLHNYIISIAYYLPIMAYQFKKNFFLQNKNTIKSGIYG